MAPMQSRNSSHEKACDPGACTHFPSSGISKKDLKIKAGSSRGDRHSSKKKDPTRYASKVLGPETAKQFKSINKATIGLSVDRIFDRSGGIPNGENPIVFFSEEEAVIRAHAQLHDFSTGNLPCPKHLTALCRMLRVPENCSVSGMKLCIISILDWITANISNDCPGTEDERQRYDFYATDWHLQLQYDPNFPVSTWSDVYKERDRRMRPDFTRYETGTRREKMTLDRLIMAAATIISGTPPIVYLYQGRQQVLEDYDHFHDDLYRSLYGQTTHASPYDITQSIFTKSETMAFCPTLPLPPLPPFMGSLS